ncbi:MAG: hypothetical protein QOK15_803 [Nocardioidaceae bacterium]|nr:hypothetical protein [Nocardioidaceae bacterium]
MAEVAEVAEVAELLELEERWPLAGAVPVAVSVSVSGAVRLRDQLLAAYAEPGRHYHDVRHLAEVLDRLDELEAHAVPFEPLPVRLAAWFHDAVYDGQQGAEERSARWAEEALSAAALPDDVVSEVARLVRLTEQHDPREDDRGGAALCDADLAVLAASPARYREYVDAVRQEYASIPEPAFRTGRATVLRALLARPLLFTTAYAVATWEAPARLNVTAELAFLDGPPER